MRSNIVIGHMPWLPTSMYNQRNSRTYSQYGGEAVKQSWVYDATPPTERELEQTYQTCCTKTQDIEPLIVNFYDALWNARTRSRGRWCAA